MTINFGSGRSTNLNIASFGGEEERKVVTITLLVLIQKVMVRRNFIEDF